MVRVTLSTWLACLAIAANYGARALSPILAHVVCSDSQCDAVELVGSMAGAFFAGDMLAQMAAKAMVARLSGRLLLTAGTAGWGSVLLVLPLVLPGPTWLLLPAQFAFGFFCGLGYPAGHALLAATVPSEVRTTAVSLIISASAAGTMASNFAVPQAVKFIGHRLPYAFFALVALLVSALVACRCPGGGASHSSQNGAKGGSNGKDTLREVSAWMKDPLIAALMFGMYASGAANAFLYNFFPALFVQAYGAAVEDLGWLTMAAPLANSVCCVLSGLASDTLMASGLQRYRCRMLMQFIGTAAPALSLMFLCSCSSTAQAAVLVTVWMGTHGFQTSGLTAAFHDVAHSRASELFAVGNVFSKFACVCAGPLIGAISKSRGWSLVLGILCVHYVAAGAALVGLLCRWEESGRLFSEGTTAPMDEGVEKENVPEENMEAKEDDEAEQSTILVRRKKRTLSVTTTDEPTKGTTTLAERVADNLLAAAEYGNDPGSPYFPGSPMSPDRAEHFPGSPKREGAEKRKTFAAKADDENGSKKKL